MKHCQSRGSSTDDKKKSTRKHHKKRSSSDRKRRHRKHSSSSSSENSLSDDDESSYERRRRKRKDKKSKKKRRKRSRNDRTDFEEEPVEEANNFGAEVHPQSQQGSVSPAEVAHRAAEDKCNQPRKSRVLAPMSKAQHEAEQSKIREVYDEESGRYRLVRGSGEVIERIVSQADHARINQAATRGDGASYARSIFQQASRKR
jgi:Nuclear RNA-splicing-associated protein